MSHRRAGDHPWDGRIRTVIGTALGLGLAWLIFSGGLHELSDLALLVLAGLIGALLKVNLSPLYRMLPGGRREGEGP